MNNKRVKMTMLHFQFIANVINDLPPKVTREEVRDLFERALVGTNDRFSRDQFNAACSYDWVAETEKRTPFRPDHTNHIDCDCMRCRPP